jgi:hypothetical protein
MFGDSVMYGDMGWTGIPAVMTTASGTQGANATMTNAQGTGNSSPTASCNFCSNPMVQEGLFIAAIILIAVGWHFHLFSLLEEG